MARKSILQLLLVTVLIVHVFILFSLLDVFEEDLQEVPSQPCEIVSPNSVMDSDFPEKIDGKFQKLVVKGAMMLVHSS